MKSWKLERDAVVEHTLALVGDVSPTHPAVNRLPVSQPSTITERPETVTGGAAASAVTVPMLEDRRRAERDEIVRRVAAFRDLQIRIGQERRQYCESVLAETRIVLGHWAKIGS
jgi:hypothetical protein